MINSVMIIIKHLHYGGSQKYTLNLVNALANQGVKVSLITVDGALTSQLSPKVNLYIIPIGRKPRIKNISERKILEIATKTKPQVIHTQDRISLVCAQLTRKTLNIPLITHEHQMYRTIDYPFVVNELSEGSDKIIAIGPYTAKALTDNGLDKKQIIPIISGVDPEAIPQITQPERDLARLRLKLKETDKVVVCLSRIVPDKGIDKLVLAFIKVIQKIPNAKLLIIGDEEKIPVKPSLYNIIRENDLQGKIFIYEGDYNIRKYHAVADVFCHPALTKGISVMEAMAAGLPIVGKETKRKPLVVEDKISGLMTKKTKKYPINPHSMAEKIILLLNNPGLSKKMGAAGRLKIEKKFTLDLVVKNILNTYKEVLFLHGIQSADNFYPNALTNLSNDTSNYQYTYNKVED